MSYTDLPKDIRPIIWIADSKEDLSEMPQPVKSSFGMRLYELQKSKIPCDTKALTQFGSGVYELRESFDTNAYRLVYAIKLKRAVYVLHVFMKKSKSGIGLSKPDSTVIEARIRKAYEMDKEKLT